MSILNIYIYIGTALILKLRIKKVCSVAAIVRFTKLYSISPTKEEHRNRYFPMLIQRLIMSA